MSVKVEQLVKQNRKLIKRASINCSLSLDSDIITSVSQRSSGVEQRFRKPPVKSSTLFAGSMVKLKDWRIDESPYR